ncbi:unnamed protein product [Dracunculus medinensis]|uniref:DUF4378 domain-containing protein n=1 Tax=Dracunculus medinensis TaxID=318479 RepID=A0A0N4UNC8_DRAME|nr:unnamed protein product [Dracunculus medinensis]
MFGAKKRREIYSGRQVRSISVPSRRKWYQKISPNHHRRIQSQKNFYSQDINYVSRHLIGAITMWHDIHASLIHLAIGQHEICSDELESISNTDLSSYQSSSSYDYFSNQDDEGLKECETHEKAIKPLGSKMSLSNPDLTADQLKLIFPELSERWRL